MALLFALFLLGALLGNLVVLALNLFSQEFASVYGTVISYPVMFIPPWLYASAKSRRDEFFVTGYALDSNHFGSLGGFRMALVVSIATFATAFIAEGFNCFMPETPEWFEDAMEQIMDAPVWVTLISVSVEDWSSEDFSRRPARRLQSLFLPHSLLYCT